MNPIKGIGWCGVWHDGALGWMLSRFVEDGQAEPLGEQQRESLSGSSRNVATSDMYRVEITVRVIKDKRGRYIVRRAKRNA